MTFFFFEFGELASDSDLNWTCSALLCLLSCVLSCCPLFSALPSEVYAWLRRPRTAHKLGCRAL